VGGLDKDGGISFGRKKDVVKEDVKEEAKEPRNEDIKDLAKDERLNAKLSKAKGINATGFALNGSTIIGAIFYLDSLLANPDTLELLNNLNGMLGSNIDFEQIIATIQGYKAQIIGFAISSQTMLMGYKDTVQKMKNRGNESFYEVFNEELGKVI
jgi:hypothetical protein